MNIKNLLTATAVLAMAGTGLADVVWTGDAGDSDWKTAGNWDTGILPDAEVVTIDSVGAVVNLTPGGDPAVTDIFVANGDLKISGAMSGGYLKIGHETGQSGTVTILPGDGSFAGWGPGFWGLSLGEAGGTGTFINNGGTAKVTGGWFVVGAAGSMQLNAGHTIFNDVPTNQVSVSGVIDLSGGVLAFKGDFLAEAADWILNQQMTSYGRTADASDYTEKFAFDYDTTNVGYTTITAIPPDMSGYVNFIGGGDAAPWGWLGDSAGWEGGIVPDGSSTTGLLSSAIVDSWHWYLGGFSLLQTGSIVRHINDTTKGVNPPDGQELLMRGGDQDSGLSTIYIIDDFRTDYASYTNLSVGQLAMWSQFGEKIELTVLSGHVEMKTLKLVTWGGEGTINLRDGLFHADKNLFAAGQLNMLNEGSGEFIIDEFSSAYEPDTAGGGANAHYEWSLLKINFESENLGRITFGSYTDASGPSNSVIVTVADVMEAMVENGQVSIDGVVDTSLSHYVIAVDGDSASLKLPGALNAGERYDLWASNFGLNADRSVSSTNDVDADGLANLTEYALGADPTVDDASTYNPQIVGTVELSGTNYVQYVYRRNMEAASLNLNYGVTVNADSLMYPNWISVGTAFETGAGAIDGTYEAVTNRVPMGENDLGFFNLEVTESF